MADAHVPHTMSDDSTAVHPAIILGNPRDEDPTTLLLRQNALAGLDDIVSGLQRYDHTSTSTASSTIPTSSVFSSRKGSVTTKPTSAGTSYPIETSYGKGKAVATYASSLSATHGSGSDTERDMARDNALAGLGDWAGAGPERAPKRKQIRQPRPKKPVVIIQGERSSLVDDRGSSTKEIGRRSGRNAKYLRRRPKQLTDDQLTLAEEGRFAQASTPPSAPVSLSRVRLLTLASLITAIVLTFSVSVWAAHHTGRSHLSSSKGIVFCATVLIAFLTVCAMITARRTLQEALLGGFMQLIIGFTLLLELGEFM